MNCTLLIARRELAEKRFVLIAAMAFAVLALLVPLIPGIRPAARREAMVILSGLLAINFTLGLAMALGATIVGRELSDGRLSFYFSKPLPAPAIWFGKLIAALALVVTSFVIAAAPALLAGPRAVMRIWTSDPLRVAFVTLAAACACFLLVHVIGTFVRSRSLWIVFDFIAATICGTAIWLIGRPLLDGFALELIKLLGKIVAIYLAMVIVAAGAWQLSRGRTDRKRSHLELSRFLWSAFGSGLLVVSLFVIWVISATPADLIADSGQQASSGSWAALSGKAKHRWDYHASFLYDLNSNRYVRVALVQQWWGRNGFSDDGKTAISLRRTSLREAEVCLTRLDVQKPKTIATGITFVPGEALLSPDGSRIIVIDGTSILTVYDLATQKSLGSVRTPAPIRWVTFPAPDTLRIYAREFRRQQETPFRILEYSLPARTLRQTGELATPSYWIRFNGDSSRVLVTSSSAELQIADARSGAVITSMAAGPGAHFVNGIFLRDGRIVSAETDGKRALVRVFTAGGVPLRDIPLPSASGATVRVEMPSGRVIISTQVQRENGFGLAVIDADHGSLLRTEPGLLPAFYGFVSARELLCTTASKELVAWNPTTGTRRIIAGHS